MDELFDRIRAAQPNLLSLTDDELARLEAWLGTYRSSRRVWAEWQNARRQAQRGDTRLLDKLNAEKGWWKHLKFTATYNRNRPKAAASAGSQSPNVLPAEAVSASDKPDEHGYVESPADSKTYAPAADILAEHTPDALSVSMKELGTILEDYHTNRVRWTRPLGKNGQPKRNRRSVHLGDWTAYVKRRVPAEEDGFPRLTEAELESRKAAVRNGKHAGK
jgi:hypothetical protein